MNDEMEIAIELWAENGLDPASHARLDAWLSEDLGHGVEFVRDMMLHRMLADLAPAPLERAAPTVKAPLLERFAKLRFAVGLGIAASLAIGIVLFLRRTNVPDAGGPTPRVATLTWTNAVVEGEAPISVGQAIASQTIKTGEGDADFLLSSGATISVSGRSEMTLHSPRITTLARGSANFESPANGRGVTVNLPNGDCLIDLGANFSVSVGSQGTIEISVAEGEVRLVRPIGEALLRAGQHFIVDQQGQLREVEAPQPLDRAQENKLVNGAFDEARKEPDVADPLLRKTSSLPPGWTQSSIFRKVRLMRERPMFKPHTPPFAAQFTGEPIGGTAIQQSVATVPGTEYELSYQATRTGGGLVAMLAVDVFDGPEATDKPGELASVRRRIGWRWGEWRAQRVRFVARSASTTIRFSEPRDFDSTGVAPLIDTVRLFTMKEKTHDPKPAPAPATTLNSL